MSGHTHTSSHPQTHLVQVALASGLDDGGADGIGPPAVAHGLVGGDQLLELLEPLVEAGVLGGGRQVGDGVGVRAALGDGGLCSEIRGEGGVREL
jgi:hypothetical protein